MTNPAPLEVAPAASLRLTAADWEARVARLRAQAAEDEIDPGEVNEAVASFRFRDEDGRLWAHDGDRWTVVDAGTAGTPVTDRPTGGLAPQPYILELVPEAGDPPAEVATVIAEAGDAEETAPDTAAVLPPYRPTHLVPVSGLPTWPAPDPSLPSDNHLDPGLDVMVLEWRPDGWAHILCSNTWTTWIDGRLLDPLEPEPAASA
jgi:hypothetical protein